ncbi:MAG: tRNA-dihydrouridine synthase, partial [Lachnospiraceae bacterium]|nr:tRNA-dihydrouridine synthase [Lachnospiraceae bacterium]
LDNFLSEIYDKSPLRISIKTRIGVESVNEWEHILAIYKKYPIAELIIHPRLQKELYKFTPHKEAFSAAIADLPNIPLCYNGDITSPKSHEELLNAVPAIDCIMIGRGILRNPALTALLKKNDAAKLFTKENLKAFHDEIFASYSAQMAGETPTLFKMKDLWTYLSESFTASDRYLKKIRKASDYAEYKIAVNNLFRECDLKQIVLGTVQK